jgi:fermentation-respiration switch protein FrsA (DUF1100 family)
MPGRRLLISLPLAVVVSGCLAVENSLVFQPGHGPDTPLPPGQTAVQEVQLPSADGAVIQARWCPQLGARGAVLYCHGNAGDLEGRGGEVRALWEALGESVLIFDYPGFGRSTGRPSEAGCYAAAEAAYDWLIHTQHVRPEDVLIYGESLGGGVAAHLAARQRHRALVLVRTFTSVPDVARGLVPGLPAHWLMVNRFNNLEEIRRCRQPIFIAQGERDRLMPWAHGEQLYAAAGGNAYLFSLKEADHNDPLGPDFYTALRSFVEVRAPRSGASP